MSTKKIIVFFIIAVVIIIAALIGFTSYRIFTKPIVQLNNKKSVIFYIPSNSTYESVKSNIEQQLNISRIDIFDFIAKKKKYPSNIKAGRYRINDGMTANQLINKLRSGDQEAIKVTFNNIRFLPKFAGIVSKKMEFDSTELIQLLSTQAYIEKLGYNKETIISLFLPNTYEFWWNTSAEQFVERMQKEHDKFWTKERLEKANAIDMTPTEVSILASIVQEETNQKSEMSQVAGVYLNRIKVGMYLQADPTARFAYGDFSVKRINYDYLKIDSPYNTYMYPGLPPGPICMAAPTTIDKVLNYEQHRYFYFCAKPDNSGTHVFAKNLRQHNRNANAYHRYLNSQNIRR